VLKAVRAIPRVLQHPAHHPVIHPEDHLHTAVAVIPAEAIIHQAAHQADPHQAAHIPVVHHLQADIPVVRHQAGEDSCK
jgi:hypothetical protein